MSKLSNLAYGKVKPDGSRRVFAQKGDKSYRECIGTLMPQASQKTLEASAAIQTWSNPRGKVATRMWSPGSVISFADQWERKWRDTYPLSSL